MRATPNTPRSAPSRPHRHVLASAKANVAKYGALHTRGSPPCTGSLEQRARYATRDIASPVARFKTRHARRAGSVQQPGGSSEQRLCTRSLDAMR
jgi:hypothetical protein